MSKSQALAMKYVDELGRYPDCPPGSVTPCAKRNAYRFIHESDRDPRNFLPVAKLSPNREFEDAAICCMSLSLSLFSSKEQDVAFYQKLKKRNKNIGKTLGTHIALVKLAEVDGMVTPDRDDSHFSLFELADVSWSGRCNDISVIA